MAKIFKKCLSQIKNCQINNFAGGGNATIQLNIPNTSKVYKIICEFWISWMLEYCIGMQGFYNFHQISLLCDHQELACMPKDPPRRVDMNEMNLIFFIIRMIELSTKPFENQLFWTCWKTAHVLLYRNRMN